jgi:hypothetical protein
VFVVGMHPMTRQLGYALSRGDHLPEPGVVDCVRAYTHFVNHMGLVRVLLSIAEALLAHE